MILRPVFLARFSVFARFFGALFLSHPPPFMAIFTFDTPIIAKKHEKREKREKTRKTRKTAKARAKTPKKDRKTGRKFGGKPGWRKKKTGEKKFAPGFFARFSP